MAPHDNSASSLGSGPPVKSTLVQAHANDGDGGVTLATERFLAGPVPEPAVQDRDEEVLVPFAAQAAALCASRFLQRVQGLGPSMEQAGCGDLQGRPKDGFFAKVGITPEVAPSMADSDTYPPQGVCKVAHVRTPEIRVDGLAAEEHVVAKRPASRRISTGRQVGSAGFDRRARSTPGAFPGIRSPVAVWLIGRKNR